MASKKGPNRTIGGVFPYNPLKREWIAAARQAHSEHDVLKSRSIAQQTIGKFEQPYLAIVAKYYAKLASFGIVTRRKANGSYYMLGSIDDLTQAQRDELGPTPIRKVVV